MNRPNLMVKVPGTPAGLPAIEQLISEGINVNVTLLFSQEVYEQVALAYIAGLEKCAESRERRERRQFLRQPDRHAGRFAHRSEITNGHGPGAPTAGIPARAHRHREREARLSAL